MLEQGSPYLPSGHHHQASPQMATAEAVQAMLSLRQHYNNNPHAAAGPSAQLAAATASYGGHHGQHHAAAAGPQHDPTADAQQQSLYLTPYHGMTTPSAFLPKQGVQQFFGSNGPCVLTPPGSPGSDEKIEIESTSSPGSHEKDACFAAIETFTSPKVGSPASLTKTTSPPKDMTASLAQENPHYPGASSGHVNVAESTLRNFAAAALMGSSPFGSFGGGQQRVSRGQKKPIPENQKDVRYFERRKRNNEAAKKSRDSRKFREQDVQMRASILERDNAYLRAQVDTLKQERTKLEHMLAMHRQIVSHSQVQHSLQDPSASVDI